MKRFVVNFYDLFYFSFLFCIFKSNVVQISSNGEYPKSIILNNGNIIIIYDQNFLTYNPETNENITQLPISIIPTESMKVFNMAKLNNGNIIVLINNEINIFNNEGYYIDAYIPVNTDEYDFSSKNTFSILPIPQLNSNSFIISFISLNNDKIIYHYYFSDVQSSTIIYKSHNILNKLGNIVQSSGNIECSDIDGNKFICFFIYMNYPINQLTNNIFLYSNLEKFEINSPFIDAYDGTMVHVAKDEINNFVCCYISFNQKTYCTNYIYSENSFNKNIQIIEGSFFNTYTFELKYLGNDIFILISLITPNFIYYFMDKNINIIGEQFSVSNELNGYTNSFSLIYLNNEIRFIFDISGQGIYINDKINICFCQNFNITSKSSIDEKNVNVDFVNHYIGTCNKIQFKDLTQLNNDIGKIYYLEDDRDSEITIESEINFLENEVYFLSKFQFNKIIELKYKIFDSSQNTEINQICTLSIIAEITENNEESDITVILTNDTIEDFVENLNATINNTDKNKTIIYEGDNYDSQINQIRNENPSNNNNNKGLKNNYSYIDFSQCEYILRNHYKIFLPETLTFVEIDINREEINQITDQIEYACYDSKGNLLDLSLCEGTIIYVTYQIKNTSNINLATVSYYIDKGIDVFNINDPFFNDICYPFSTEDGRDIILEDRRKEIFQNISLCEENCEYSSFSLENLTITCACNVKTKINTKITPNFFYKGFKSIFINSNFQVVKCYKLVFTIIGKKGNIGFWIFFILTISHFPFYIWLCIRKIKPLINYIDKVYNLHIVNPPKKKDVNIVLEEKKSKENKKDKKIYKDYISKIISVNSKELEKRENKKIKEFYNQKRSVIGNFGSNNNFFLNQKEEKNNYEFEYDDDDNNNDIFDEINIDKNNPRKKEKRLTFKKNSAKSSASTISSYELKYNQDKRRKNLLLENNNEKLKIQKKKSKKLNNNEDTKNSEKISVYSKSPLRPKLQYTTHSTTENIMNTINIETIQKENPEKIPSNDYLNDLNYEESLIYDNRTFWKIYYLNLLTKQSILNTFLFKSPFELKYIRIIMFIFGNSLDFALNALFFFQSAISKRYHYEGKLGYLFDLQNSLYINIISTFSGFLIGIFFSLLNNSKGSFEKLFNDKNKNPKLEKYKSILKCMKIKLIFFIIIEFLLILFFWYYVTAFCAVYHSSQKSWAIGGLNSFLLSMITPFLIALILTILRKIAMKKKIKCLFNLSNWFYDL